MCSERPPRSAHHHPPALCCQLRSHCGPQKRRRTPRPRQKKGRMPRRAAGATAATRRGRDDASRPAPRARRRVRRRGDGSRTSRGGRPGGLGAQLAAALGALGLSAGRVAGGGDELAAMARDGMDLQAAFSSSKPVVLEFYSKDCAHCRESSKRLHEVERAHPEVSWVMVDTQDESNRVLWERLGVDEIPHFAFLDAGKELRRTEVGPISTDRAEAGIRSVVIPGM